MRKIILYTRPGCHLCDEALDSLMELRNNCSVRLDIKEVNILDDPALYTRYRHAIPVIAVDPDAGGPTVFAPITAAKLQRALSSDRGCTGSPGEETKRTWDSDQEVKS